MVECFKTFVLYLLDEDGDMTWSCEGTEWNLFGENTLEGVKLEGRGGNGGGTFPPLFILHVFLIGDCFGKEVRTSKGLELGSPSIW